MIAKINKINLNDSNTMESLYTYYEKKQALKKRKSDQIITQIKQVLRLLNKQWV